MDMGDKAKFHTIESHLSPKLHRELHQAPKPKEVSYGVFKDTKQVRSKIAPKKQNLEKQEARRKKIGAFHMKFVKRMALKSKNVLDALRGHERPEAMSLEPEPLLPSAVSDLTCLDAVGCRRNALIKRTRGLPVFSPLDEWEPFSAQALPEVDFVYIQVEGRVHMGLFPFTGSRWYAAEVCEYLLERQIVGVGNCKAALRATRHVPSDALERMMRTIEDVY
jgi:hypothetical protein